MGVIKFNGITSKDLGVEVETFPNYEVPEKEYQVTHIPGRNGDLVVDTKTFQNVPRSYEVSVATNGVPIDVVNAAVARFKSSSRMPIKSLLSEIKAVQDLHGYDHPWVGGAGKNKLEFPYTDSSKTVSGITYTVKDNGDIAISGTATAASYFTFNHARQLVGNGQYIFSKGTTDTVILGADRCRISNNAYINRYADNTSSPTTPEITINIEDADNNYARFWISVKNGETVNTIIHPMIRLASEPDATFEPYSNICPITGFDSAVVNVCGVNLWDEEWENGIWSTNGTKISDPNAIRSKNYIAVVPGSSIYLVLPFQIVLRELDINKNVIKTVIPSLNRTFILSPNTKYIVFCTFSNTKITSYSGGISFNYPSSDTQYHAYNGNTYTFTFGQTVYGGHFDNKGNLVVTHRYITYNSATGFVEHSSGRFYKAELPTGLDYANRTESISNVATYLDREIYGSYFAFGSAGIYINRVSASETLTDFNTRLSNTPFEVVYPLANPITLSITSLNILTILGENNIFSDCGNVSVKVEPSFSTIINQVAEWLHSASGYARLEDTYDPDHYRMAYYSESLSVENLFNEAGKATLNFICKPQRYLKSGETPISFTEEGTIQNGTRFSSSPVLKVITDNTQGSISIGNHTIAIKAGAGTDPITIDCELQDAWSGTTNKNPFIILTDGEFPVIDPGVQTITFDGGVQSVEVTPRWWTV